MDVRERERERVTRGEVRDLQHFQNIKELPSISIRLKGDVKAVPYSERTVLR